LLPLAESRRSAAPIAAGGGDNQGAARAGATLLGVLRHAAQLSEKLGPVVRSHGVAESGRRAWRHLMGYGQLMSWEISRWRLQQRVGNQRSRS
jgi:hypothetical protein